MGTRLDRTWQQLLLADQLEKQRGMCPICTFQLSHRDAVLNRANRTGNYLPDNVRALHADCEALVLRKRIEGDAARTVIAAAE